MKYKKRVESHYLDYFTVKYNTECLLKYLSNYQIIFYYIEILSNKFKKKLS